MRLGDRHQAHPRRVVQPRGSLPAHDLNDSVLPEPAQDLAPSLRRAAQQPRNRCRRAAPAGVHRPRAQLQPASLPRRQHHQQQPQTVRRRASARTPGQYPGGHRLLAPRGPPRPEQDLAQAQQYRELLPRQRQGCRRSLACCARCIGTIRQSSPVGWPCSFVTTSESSTCASRSRGSTVCATEERDTPATARVPPPRSMCGSPAGRPPSPSAPRRPGAPSPGRRPEPDHRPARGRRPEDESASSWSTAGDCRPRGTRPARPARDVAADEAAAAWGAEHAEGPPQPGRKPAYGA